MSNLSIGPESRTLVDRMEHAHIGVADIERSLDFYRRALGFELRYRERGLYGPCAHVGTDRFYIALSERPGIAPAGGSGGHAEIYHLGFSTPDMDALRARLDAEGIPVAMEADREEGPAVYLNDPDGHEIEVVGYRKGYVYA